MYKLYPCCVSNHILVLHQHKLNQSVCNNDTTMCIVDIIVYNTSECNKNKWMLEKEKSQGSDLSARNENEKKTKNPGREIHFTEYTYSLSSREFRLTRHVM